MYFVPWKRTKSKNSKVRFYLPTPPPCDIFKSILEVPSDLKTWSDHSTLLWQGLYKLRALLSFERSRPNFIQNGLQNVKVRISLTLLQLLARYGLQLEHTRKTDGGSFRNKKWKKGMYYDFDF